MNQEDLNRAFEEAMKSGVTIHQRRHALALSARFVAPGKSAARFNMFVQRTGDNQLEFTAPWLITLLEEPQARQLKAELNVLYPDR